MGITIKELSEISGYSPSTISRVITNKGNVKKETREKVERLLQEYDYRISIMELRSTANTKNNVLIIVGDIHNWYYMEIISEISKILNENGLMSIIGFSDNNESQQNMFLQKAFEQNYAGTIFLNVIDGEELRQMIKQQEHPVVFLNRGLKSMDLEVDVIRSDNYWGGYLATKHLIDMGHRKIAHLTGSLYSATTFERMRGYEDAMRDARLAVTKNSIFYGDLKSESGYAFGENYIKKGLDYTAVFCGNDLMAVGVAQAMRDYGVSIPDDISVICYDDTPLVADGRIRMTTVGVKASKMARGAIELLLSKINGSEQETKTILYKPQLHVRDSVKKIKNDL